MTPSPLALVAALATTAAAAAPAVTQTDLYSFASTSPAGTTPRTGLVADSHDNLFGATSGGGKHRSGAIFELKRNGRLQVLYSTAKRGCDAGYGSTVLSLDAAGNLYGSVDETAGCKFGSVWRLAPDHTLTVLHSFTGRADGGHPVGPLVFDANGNGYGAARYGGRGRLKGLIFKIAPDGTESTFYTFSGPDGSEPSGLAIDGAGNLVGAAFGGGANGYGAIFHIDVATGAETLLFSFTNDDVAGANPYGPPVIDSAGNIYGVDFDGLYRGRSRDAVYRLTPGGTPSIVLKQNSKTGLDIVPDLTIDSRDNVYAVLGGSDRKGVHSGGAIYRINPLGHAALYYGFTDGPLSYAPNGPLVAGHHGTLFGTTQVGGSGNSGAVFELTK